MQSPKWAVRTKRQTKRLYAHTKEKERDEAFDSNSEDFMSSDEVEGEDSDDHDKTEFGLEGDGNILPTKVTKNTNLWKKIVPKEGCPSILSLIL